MKTSIWVHHPGQWLYPDTDSNLNLNLGEMEFIKLSYSLIYSLPEVHNCGEYNLNSFDYCIRHVCEIHYFYQIIQNTNNFNLLHAFVGAR